MTAHVHDRAIESADEAVDALPGDGSARSTSTQPRWLMPGIAVGVVVAGLVAAGVISLSTALYAAMFGGMLLMHLGGHGMHRGHGGGGHDSHAGGGSSDDRAPSEPQSMAQPDSPSSAGDTRTDLPDAKRGSGSHQHDQRGSHGCH